MRCERGSAQGASAGNGAFLRLRSGREVSGRVGLALLALRSLRGAGAADGRGGDCEATRLGHAAGDCGPATGPRHGEGAQAAPGEGREVHRQ